MTAGTGTTRWSGGPHAQREQLVSAGARFTVVGSVATGTAEPHDLDVRVAASEADLAALLAAIGAVGGQSRLSSARPTTRRLREAGMWQFGTAWCPLDVFIDGAAACD